MTALSPAGGIEPAAGLVPSGTTPPRVDRIEFLMFGYRAPDGRVHLLASTDVRSAEITAEIDWDRLWPDVPPRNRFSLTAEMGEYVWAIGDDYPAAMRRVADGWGGK